MSSRSSCEVTNRTVGALRSCVETYRELLGEPLHPTAPVLIEVPDGYGSSGMSDALVLARDDLTQGGDNKFPYHELAHAWSSWRGPKWIHEGYTEFLAITAVMRLHGQHQADARWSRQG